MGWMVGKVKIERIGGDGGLILMGVMKDGGILIFEAVIF